MSRKAHWRLAVSLVICLAIGQVIGCGKDGIPIDDPTPALTHSPVIDAAGTVYSEALQTLTVVVNDEDTNDTLTVNVTEPAGLDVDATSRTATATGPKTAVFHFTALATTLPDTGSTKITRQVTIFASDTAGHQSASVTRDVVVEPTTPEQRAPVIGTVTYNAATGVMSVPVTDPDSEDTMSVTVTAVTGLSVVPNNLTVTGLTSGGAATFTWSAEDQTLGGAGNTTISVSDGHSHDPAPATKVQAVSVARSMPRLDPDPDDANLPTTGMGTATEPYGVTAGEDYLLQVIAPGETDVSTDAGTTYTLAPTGIATITPAEAKLHVEASAELDAVVSVLATYDGQDTNTVYFKVVTINDQDPVAGLTVCGADGSTPLDPSVDVGAAGIAVVLNAVLPSQPSYDPDNSPIEHTPGAGIILYEWDLDGDGTFETAGGNTPTYTFPDPLVVPTGQTTEDFSFGVRVTEDEADGTTASATAALELVLLNTLPVPILTATPTLGYDVLTVFFDASTSYDPDGTIVNWEWDFDGDSNFNEAANGEDLAEGDNSPQYVFSAYGHYTVRVRVTDNRGATNTDSVEIILDRSPLADLKADQYNLVPPGTVNFSATDSSDPDSGDMITKYEFDFGEGAGWVDNGTVATINHQYSTSGSFDAMVRVTDNHLATDIDTKTITVNTPPVAEILADPESGKYDLMTVDFDARGSHDPDANGGITDYEWDFDGDGVFNEGLVADPNSEAAARGNNTPQHTYGQADITITELLQAKVRITDNLGATNIAEIGLDIQPYYPTARFTITFDVDNPDNDCPFEVLVNATLSHDDTTEPGNQGIVSYRYDWGDGTSNVYDTPTTKSHTYTYPTGAAATDIAEWTRLIRLTVTDVDGATDYTEADETGLNDFVIRGWRRSTIVSGGSDIGRWTSMIEVDGNPAIAYYDATHTDLYYVRANQAIPYQASHWGTPVAVHTSLTLDLGQYASMAMVGADAYPAIAYYDATTKRVLYVRAADSDGTTWQTPIELDDGAVKGFVSLAMINLNPAVTYIRSSGGVDQVMYIRATDTTGTAWGAAQQVEVAVGTDTYEYTSLASVNGRPAVVYRDVDNTDLMFERAGDADGMNWAGGGVAAHASFAGVVQDCRLTIVNNFPIITYYNFIDEQRRNVVFLPAENTSGSSWDYDNDAIIIGQGRFASCQQPDEAGLLPWISYYEFATHPEGRLKCARVDPSYNDPYGHAPPASELGPELRKDADPTIDVGQYTSLLMLKIATDSALPALANNWRPAISYYDNTAGSLKFVIYN